MKRIYKAIPPLAAGILAGLFLAYPDATIQAACDACNLWAQSVMPGLFPFLVVMLYLTRFLPGSQPKGTNQRRMTGLPTGGVRLAAMGLLSGSPGGARLALERITLFTPRSLLCFGAYTGTMSPMFIIGTLGGWIGSHRFGAVMLLAHWIGALLAGQIVNLVSKPSQPAISNIASTPPAAGGLSQLINSAAQAMLTVCGCMMLGNVLAVICQQIFPLPDAWAAAMQSALEVTAGCHRILRLGISNTYLEASLLCAAVSFGGVSILMQNLAFYQSALSPYKLVGVRLLHAILAGCVCYLLLPLLGGAKPDPQTVTVFTSNGVSGQQTLLLAMWFLALFPWHYIIGKRREN